MAQDKARNVSYAKPHANERIYYINRSLPHFERSDILGAHMGAAYMCGVLIDKHVPKIHISTEVGYLYVTISQEHLLFSYGSKAQRLSCKLIRIAYFTQGLYLFHCSNTSIQHNSLVCRIMSFSMHKKFGTKYESISSRSAHSNRKLICQEVAKSKSQGFRYDAYSAKTEVDMRYLVL